MRNIDATKGPLLRQIFAYTVPLIIASIIQDLFTAVDKAVLGNMADTAAVASVGATAVITNLIVTGFIGLSGGTSIVLARYIGKGDVKSARDTIGTTLISSVGFGVITAVVGLVFAPLLLTLMKCPEECYGGALLYLRIYICSAPAILIYNYGSAILRALGDTKSSLKFIMIGGFINVVLNIILCLVLEQKVAAVAIATVVSNLISALLVVNRLCNFGTEYGVSLKVLRFNMGAFLLIIKYGIPTALNNLVMPLANVQITSAVNSCGVDAIAGNSAALSMQSLNRAFYAGFGLAALTFMGQNIGAQNRERVKKTFVYCFLIGVGIGGTLGVLLYLTGETWLGIMLGGSATAAIEYGLIRMFCTNLFIFLFAADNIIINALQAYGYPIFGTISALVFALGFRVVWMEFIYPLNPTYFMIMISYVVSTAMNIVVDIIAFAVIHRRFMRGVYKRV